MYVNVFKQCAPPICTTRSTSKADPSPSPADSPIRIATVIGCRRWCAFTSAQEGLHAQKRGRARHPQPVLPQGITRPASPTTKSMRWSLMPLLRPARTESEQARGGAASCEPSVERREPRRELSSSIVSSCRVVVVVVVISLVLRSLRLTRGDRHEGRAARETRNGNGMARV